LPAYPSADKVTPLIIVGPPRSGTRFITNVLNEVPGVTVQGEIPVFIIDRIIRTVKRFQRMYVTAGPEKELPDKFSLASKDFMFAVWANLQKGKRREAGDDCRYFGYKTPYHEKYFDFYNTFFDPVQPIYICCIRRFEDHLLSVQARWPGRGIAYVALRYILSLRRIRLMKEKRPDRVLLFFLDDYKAQGSSYLHEKIFVPLELKDVRAAVKRAELGPVNTSVKHGCLRKDMLAGRQQLFLKLFPRPLQDFEALRRDYGQ